MIEGFRKIKDREFCTDYKFIKNPALKVYMHVTGPYRFNDSYKIVFEDYVSCPFNIGNKYNIQQTRYIENSIWNFLNDIPLCNSVASFNYYHKTLPLREDLKAHFGKYKNWNWKNFAISIDKFMDNINIEILEPQSFKDLWETDPCFQHEIKMTCKFKNQKEIVNNIFNKKCNNVFDNEFLVVLSRTGLEFYTSTYRDKYCEYDSFMFKVDYNFHKPVINVEKLTKKCVSDLTNFHCKRVGNLKDQIKIAAKEFDVLYDCFVNYPQSGDSFVNKGE